MPNKCVCNAMYVLQMNDFSSIESKHRDSEHLLLCEVTHKPSQFKLMLAQNISC